MCSLDHADCVHTDVWGHCVFAHCMKRALAPSCFCAVSGLVVVALHWSHNFTFWLWTMVHCPDVLHIVYRKGLANIFLQASENGAAQEEATLAEPSSISEEAVGSVRADDASATEIPGLSETPATHVAALDVTEATAGEDSPVALCLMPCYGICAMLSVCFLSAPAGLEACSFSQHSCFCLLVSLVHSRGSAFVL